jgi:hypothetical protein
MGRANFAELFLVINNLIVTATHDPATVGMVFDSNLTPLTELDGLSVDFLNSFATYRIDCIGGIPNNAVRIGIRSNSW